MSKVREKLAYVSLRGLDDFAFSIVLTIVFGAPAAVFGWQGLFTLGVFFTLLGITFRSKDIVDVHYSRGMDEADDTIEERVEIYAERLGIPTPEVRVQGRSGMKSDHGKEKYGYVVPNPLDRDIVVLNEVAEKWLVSTAIGPEEKQDMFALVAHEVAHVAQRPRTSLVQSLTLGVPFFVAAGASTVVSWLWAVVGVAVLAAIIRKGWITVLFRRAEFDAEKKSVELAGPDAVRGYYDDVEPVWYPFSSSPSQWCRVAYLEANGLL